MVSTIKFSQMTDGGDIANNDQVPGLLGGGNVLFNNPWTFLPPGTTAERPAPSAEINYRLRFNTDDQLYEYYDAILGQWTQLQESFFTSGPFLTYTASANLPDAFNLGSLTDGILKQTVITGVSTPSIAINGTDYYGPGFTGYLEAPVGIKDILGNVVIQFISQANPVNFIAITNAPTTADPGFNAQGTDLNIGIGYASKGSGIHKFYSAGTVAMEIHSGTGYQRVSQFLFEDVSAGFTYTFPQESGTIALVGGGTVVDSLTGTQYQVLVNNTFGTPKVGTCVLTLPQDIDTTSSPTFAAITVPTLYDANSLPALTIQTVSSQVNYFSIYPQPSGSGPTLAAVGSDPNVDFNVLPQGTGAFQVLSSNLTNPFVITNGTSKQHVTNFIFSNTSAVRNVTFQDSDGTLAYLTDIPGGGVTDAEVQQSAFNTGTDTGVADAYIVDLTPAISSLTDGLEISFEALNANATNSPTLTVNGFTASVVDNLGSPIAIGDFGYGNTSFLKYSASLGGWMYLNAPITNVNATNMINGFYLSGTDSGAADAYVVTLSSGVGGFNPGYGSQVTFLPANSNTTSSTLNVNGSGATAITLMDGSALTAGMLSSSSQASLVYGVNQIGNTAWILLNPQIPTKIAPTQQIFTSGSGTYTTPSGVLYIRVVMIGGGGGGGGSGTAANPDGSPGAATTFGTSLLSAGGGSGGPGGANSDTGGAGGTSSLGGASGTALSGANGSSPAGDTVLSQYSGGAGGNTAFGGGGASTYAGAAGGAAVTNTGGGGAGASTGAVGGFPGLGGGAGGFINAIIPSPSATYSYAVGSGGAAGTAGPSGFAGGNGGSGYIEITEYYQ